MYNMYGSSVAVDRSDAQVRRLIGFPAARSVLHCYATCAMNTVKGRVGCVASERRYNRHKLGKPRWLTQP